VTINTPWRKLRYILVRLTRLKRRRLEKGWTLRDLRDATGFSVRTLSLLERGETEPRPATISRLATVLECRPVDLMEPESPSHFSD